LFTLIHYVSMQGVLPISRPESKTEEDKRWLSAAAQSLLVEDEQRRADNAGERGYRAGTLSACIHPRKTFLKLSLAKAVRLFKVLPFTFHLYLRSFYLPPRPSVRYLHAPE
jgi:hypothetical protein